MKKSYESKFNNYLGGSMTSKKYLDPYLKTRNIELINRLNKINDIGYDSTVLPNMVEYFKNN